MENKLHEEIIIAGFGGQGILFLGKVLAEVGMAHGKHVSWIPSYGPEMRGGTANCCVVISDENIASPLVEEPNTLIVMNRPSVAKFQPKVKKDGIMLYNSSLISGETLRDDIKIYAVPASEIADEIGTTKVANLVLAGAYFKICPSLNFNKVLDLLPTIIPAKKADLAELNRKALIRGYEFIKL